MTFYRSFPLGVGNRTEWKERDCCVCGWKINLDCEIHYNAPIIGGFGICEAYTHVNCFRHILSQLWIDVREDFSLLTEYGDSNEPSMQRLK